MDKNFISGTTVFSLRHPPLPEAFSEGVIIPVDKPLGWTSADAVRKIKFALQRKMNQKKLKAGHAGTLDPLATGVLLVCTGKATKQAGALQSEEKEYIAEIETGATTPSFDLEKEVDARYPFAHITRAMIDDALKAFVGTQEQIPPVFSAKMLGGTRAYKFAHAGQDAVMKPSVITVYETELMAFNPPKLTVRIVCSKGTYIRAFARDLGAALQSGAHLTGLRRTRSGKFNIQTLISLEGFEKFLLDI